MNRLVPYRLDSCTVSKNIERRLVLSEAEVGAETQRNNISAPLRLRVKNFGSGFSRLGIVLVLLSLTAVLTMTACAKNETVPATTAAVLTAVPTIVLNLPEVTAVTLDRTELPNYESLEMTLALTAQYNNPYDAREVTVDGYFTAPDGTEMQVPGFWDGEEAWRLRFTPSQVGEWQYQIAVTDINGISQPAEGTFTVKDSDLHGWLQPGNLVNPAYSGRYLVHHDGTPFYGLGHADALNILIDGFDVERGVGLFNSMVEDKENYVVWWPLYNTSPVTSSYDDYSVANMNVMDLVVQDAQEKDIFLIFTIWDHPNLRDDNHDWDTGNWANNGFSKLSSIDDFFTEEDPWVWQENLYRYIIARWGYSPAIGMWQTVTEINGTNAFDQTDPWHNKVNAYFVENDPYRHPTTASRSGDVDWEEGHLQMDAPQVHVYALQDGAVDAAETVAFWTKTMWDRVEKPNWIGEFGVPGNAEYPELFHNALWAALGSGAAMTPAEWNSGGSWMRMSDEMLADMNRLGQFVADLPLAELNPAALQMSSSDPTVRGWGVAGEAGGLFWVQDFALDGRPIEEVRANETVRQGVVMEMEGLSDGRHTITPYDTWQGLYLEPFVVECTTGQTCAIPLPDFQADMAFKITRE